MLNKKIGDNEVERGYVSHRDTEGDGVHRGEICEVS